MLSFNYGLIKYTAGKFKITHFTCTYRNNRTSSFPLCCQFLLVSFPVFSSSLANWCCLHYSIEKFPTIIIFLIITLNFFYSFSFSIIYSFNFYKNSVLTWNFYNLFLLIKIISSSFIFILHYQFSSRDN